MCLLSLAGILRLINYGYEDVLLFDQIDASETEHSANTLVVLEVQQEGDISLIESGVVFPL